MVIRDAIHKDIVIEDEIILRLIETNEFQRLRKIKQLGLTYIVFPSAEHTRYSHSIGVYTLARQMIQVVEQSRQIRYEKSEVESLQIAALLHDIGHGPFSHTAEELFNYSHEDYSVKIILDKRTQINQVLREYCPELIEQIVQFIEKKHPNPILNKVLSNTIDVDRMDYLLRDSHHCGVVYGHLDVNRILKMIDVKDEQLVFLEKGRQTLEDFILSRYHMFGQVYLNPKTIGNEQIVRTLLKRTHDLYSEGDYRFRTNIKKLTPFFSDEEVSVSDYLKMNDYVLSTIIEDMADKEVDPVLRDLSRAFVRQTPFVYEVDNEDDYYVFESDEYRKKIYNESVKIVTKDGSIVNLEDISQLVKFCKETLEITCASKKYYLEKNETKTRNK